MDCCCWASMTSKHSVSSNRKGCAFALFRAVAGGPRTSVPADLMVTLVSYLDEGVAVVSDVFSLRCDAAVISHAVAVTESGDFNGADLVDMPDGRGGVTLWLDKPDESFSPVEDSACSASHIGGGVMPSGGNSEADSESAVVEGDLKDSEWVLRAKSLVSLPLDMLAFSQPDLVPILD